MSLPEDYDLALELPATINLGGKVMRVTESRTTSDEKQVIFVKMMTEDEYAEELGIEEEE